MYIGYTILINSNPIPPSIAADPYSLLISAFVDVLTKNEPKVCH